MQANAFTSNVTICWRWSNEYKREPRRITKGKQEESQKASKKKDNFYEFKYHDKGSSQKSCTEVEAREYLSNVKRIECLHKYSTIKKLFCMYNTVLSSSAPVERLFSVGGAVLIPKQNWLTGAKFEKLLFMHYNKHF